MEHLKEQDMEFMKEILTGFSSRGRTSLITKIMASLHYAFCDSANISFSLHVCWQLWQKVYQCTVSRPQEIFFLITSRKKRQLEKKLPPIPWDFQAKNVVNTKKNSYQQLQHDNINILAQITNMSSQIYTFITPCTWPMSKLDKNK